MLISIRVLLLVATTLYQAIASWLEDRQPPPGQLIDVGQCRLHLYIAGEGSPSKHWITMSREMMNLEKSARQVSIAKHFGMLPIVSIKASSFFKPSFWTIFIPLKGANQLREKMHVELCNLSTDCLHVEARKSGHFVWIDQPDVIVDAVRTILRGRLKSRKAFMA